MAESFNLYQLASARVDVVTDPDNPTFVVGGVDTNNGGFAAVASFANPGLVLLTLDAERRLSERATIEVQVEGNPGGPAIATATRAANGLQFSVALRDFDGNLVNTDFGVVITEQRNG